MAQIVKNLLEMQGQSLGREDRLEEEWQPSPAVACRIPRTEELVGYSP